jgi:hypothetical protein
MAYKRTRGLVRLFFGTVPDDQIHRAYGVRVALFFVLVFRALRSDGRLVVLDRPAVERPGDRQDDHVWWLIVARKP